MPLLLAGQDRDVDEAAETQIEVTGAAAEAEILAKNGNRLQRLLSLPVSSKPFAAAKHLVHGPVRRVKESPQLPLVPQASMVS